ncbi:MAG: hypothetical protein LCH88_09100 [Proteobacteria bacterium]|nr:hypothetical protein [Pseudomonadota bacterium]
MARTKTLLAEAPLSADRMTAEWQKTNATYLAGRAEIDGVDALAGAMEAKWGVDRLRLLVGPDLREKFDRQRLKLNQAIRQGSLEDVRREAPRMATAWRVLDREAMAAGATACDPDVLEIAMPCGMVAAIVRDIADARKVQSQADGRRVAVYSHDEIGRILERFRDVSAVKVMFPGAEVTAVRPLGPRDPLQAVETFDDSIPF